ncbi:MAG: ParB N-terminal domain-containing protein [Caulobacter sp.]
MSKEPGQRLGRGLAALLGDQRPAPAAAPAAAPAPGPGVASIPVEHLEPGPFQPRGDFDPASMAELVDSIRARGILQPLLARPHPEAKERFQIIADARLRPLAPTAPDRHGLHEDWATLGPALEAAVR